MGIQTERKVKRKDKLLKGSVIKWREEGDQARGRMRRCGGQFTQPHINISELKSNQTEIKPESLTPPLTSTTP